MSPGDEHDSFGGVGGSGQTRTRLPEGNSGDVYGGARRPVRSSRSLITVVGVVVLLVAAIAFANRGVTPEPVEQLTVDAQAEHCRSHVVQGRGSRGFFASLSGSDSLVWVIHGCGSVICVHPVHSRASCDPYYVGAFPLVFRQSNELG